VIIVIIVAAMAKNTVTLKKKPTANKSAAKKPVEKKIKEPVENLSSRMLRKIKKIAIDAKCATSCQLRGRIRTRSAFQDVPKHPAFQPSTNSTANTAFALSINMLAQIPLP
jgi:hypothetical protein